MIVTEDLTKIFKKRRGKSSSFSSRLLNSFRKKHNKVIALDHVNLNIKKGETFGLIGLNGAGKTTFVRVLSTMVKPDGGHVLIDGHDVVRDDMFVKRHVGVVGSEFSRSLYWRLTGRQNLEFFAGLYEMSKQNARKRISELLDLFGLSEWQNELVMRYSTGMKQKLCIAKALLNDAKILLFDEPTAGLDPISRKQLKSTIETELKEKTIIWTSHNLTEIEEMCDRIALIHCGKVILHGNLSDIKKEYNLYKRVEIEFDSHSSDLFAHVDEIRIKDPKRILITSNELSDTLYVVMEIVNQHGLVISDIRSYHMNLEDIFLKIMGDRA